MRFLQQPLLRLVRFARAFLQRLRLGDQLLGQVLVLLVVQAAVLGFESEGAQLQDCGFPRRLLDLGLVLGRLPVHVLGNLGALLHAVQLGLLAGQGAQLFPVGFRRHLATAVFGFQRVELAFQRSHAVVEVVGQLERVGRQSRRRFDWARRRGGGSSRLVFTWAALVTFRVAVVGVSALSAICLIIGLVVLVFSRLAVQVCVGSVLDRLFNGFALFFG